MNKISIFKTHFNNEGLTSAEEAAELVHEHDKLMLKRAREAHEKHNRKLINDGKVPEAFEGIKSNDGFIVINMKPIVHKLPENKPATRKVFTFAGIQASKSVTYDRKTNKVYNNTYPDAPRNSGLVIPMSLRMEENRPPSQLKTNEHRQKRLQKVEDYQKMFKKIVRVDKQRQDWEKTEEVGVVVKKWYKNEANKTPKRKKRKKKQPKRPSKKKKAKKRISKKKTPQNKRKK